MSWENQGKVGEFVWGKVDGLLDFVLSIHFGACGSKVIRFSTLCFSFVSSGGLFKSGRRDMPTST